jgi:hypothetical protein
MSDTQQPNISNEQPLSVTLAAQQWQAVMLVLAEGPYRIVGPLIDSIKQQCMADAMASRQEYIPRRGNGADVPRPSSEV